MTADQLGEQVILLLEGSLDRPAKLHLVDELLVAIRDNPTYLPHPVLIVWNGIRDTMIERMIPKIRAEQELEETREEQYQRTRAFRPENNHE